MYNTLVCDFSTTGQVERTASQIVMMDIFRRYFHYIAYCICGIPTITLTGMPGDWQRLTDKVLTLQVFDLDWWLAHLLPICTQFVRASRGDVDLTHWQSICKRREAYGRDIINGWIAKLFPYLRAFDGGPCNKLNPIFETGEGFQTSDAPSGLSRVPFTWHNVATGQRRGMEAIGGLVGGTQDPRTLALQPKVGWAVREAEKMDLALERVLAEHTTFPGLPQEEVEQLPPDMAKFYYLTNGADLFGHGDGAAFRIVPAGDIEPLDSGESPDQYKGVSWFDGRTWLGAIWHRFAWLAEPQPA